MDQEYDLQWTPHIHNTFSGGGAIKSSEFTENLPVVHHVIKPEIAKREGGRPSDISWNCKTRDFACRGEKKAKEGITSYMLKN
jgi:hypothetical protein